MFWLWVYLVTGTGILMNVAAATVHCKMRNYSSAVIHFFWIAVLLAVFLY